MVTGGACEAHPALAVPGGSVAVSHVGAFGEIGMGDIIFLRKVDPSNACRT